MRIFNLIKFLMFIFPSLFLYSFENSSYTTNFLKEEKVDINGDGKLDEISISAISESGDFVLKINEISIKDKVGEEEEVDGFIVIDIDATDKYKEVAVHNPGPSSDDEYVIYYYDGKSIIEMGRIKRWPNFFGNGIILVDDWMGFWSKRDKYVLNNKTRKLDFVPQEFYYVGVEAKVKESFPIYRKREGSEIVANLKPDSKILIILCDVSSKDYECHYYLIKSETGLIGWAKLKSFQYKVEGLPWAD